MTKDLARFVDRYTMRHERTYPHPIERVWAAVTTPEHMDRWMLPSNTVEPRLGGKFSMTFGGPPDPDAHDKYSDAPLWGEISAWEPPTLVEYQFAPGNGSIMRFELEAIDGGTRLTFVHKFPVGTRGTAVPGDPGGDLPGGPDTPWRPGFVAGFHLQMDNLAGFLDGEDVSYHPGRDRSDWEQLCQIYRRHIIDTIPGGVSA